MSNRARAAESGRPGGLRRRAAIQVRRGRAAPALAERPAGPPGGAAALPNHMEISHANAAIQNTISGDLNQYNVTQVYYQGPSHERGLNQLPPPLADFVGRERAREQLTGALNNLGPSQSVICSLYGMGGIGKTALAVWVAHAVAAAFPDGILFIEMQGSSDEPRAIAAGLQHALQPFYGYGALLPGTLSSLAALYRQALYGKRVLVVLDDVRDVEAIRHFAPPAGSALLVTGRERMLVDGAAPGWALPSLQPDDARTLLLLAAPHLAADPLVPVLLERCDYLPLVVRLAGAILDEQPWLGLDRFLERLDDQARQPTVLQHQDRNAYTILGLSEALLAQRDPELARRWRMLHVCAAPFDRAVAAAIWAEPDADDAEAQLAELRRRSLLGWDAVAGRYLMPNMLRDLARQRCAPDDRARAALLHARFFNAVTSRAKRMLANRSTYARGMELLEEGWSQIVTAQDYVQRTLRATWFEDISGPTFVLAARLHFVRAGAI